ncbi:MAG: L,D-transpeptidase family protein [Chitinophagaceae bacterium]|nr:L,D-transpeptidase family protein [Chitinophagaceae bacterium]
MIVQTRYRYFIYGAFGWLCIFGGVFLLSCNNATLPKEEKVETADEIDATAGALISDYVDKALSDSGKVNGSFWLGQPQLVKAIYERRGFTTQWSEKDSLFPVGDSLIAFIRHGRNYGLFPENYHYSLLDSLRRRIGTLGGKLDAVTWGETDILLTDAFAQILHDIKIGRLPSDSVTGRIDSALSESILTDQFDFLLRGKDLSTIVSQLEPRHTGYRLIKEAIPAFLASARFDKEWTKVPFPVKDSALYREKLFKRLQEEGLIPDSLLVPDRALMITALKTYQKENGLTDDGRIGAQTAQRLNSSDQDRFFQLAITLDRYKLLPPEMPEKYLWVNIPSYQLNLIEKDEVILQSRIVVGKPITRTPVLTSAISQMITYPQWTIPTSIIAKEILPALKRDPGYLAKKGYSLINGDGEEVDPYSVDWSKYSKGIPYKVVQGSGDDNALGILKFNFNNKYSVYLHDTNQRYFFSRAERALSHGCVRVQSWKELADFIIRNDSTQAVEKNNRNFLPSDSLSKWLINKEKHTIAIRNRIPVFIRYFTCEAKDGRLTFYDDIYQEDALLKKHYISVKN